jgi:predicted kinase
VNGPFAVGKSTTAKLLHQQAPLSLLIAVDDIRRLLWEFRSHQQESLSLTEEIGRAMARVALLKGHDVVMEGIKVQSKDIDPWIDCAKSVEADVLEILLWTDRETVLRRAAARGYGPGGLLTPELVGRAWDRLNELRAERRGMVELNTEQLAPDQVLQTITLAIDERSSQSSRSSQRP